MRLLVKGTRLVFPADCPGIPAPRTSRISRPAEFPIVRVSAVGRRTPSMWFIAPGEPALDLKLTESAPACPGSMAESFSVDQCVYRGPQGPRVCGGAGLGSKVAAGAPFGGRPVFTSTGIAGRRWRGGNRLGHRRAVERIPGWGGNNRCHESYEVGEVSNLESRSVDLVTERRSGDHGRTDHHRSGSLSEGAVPRGRRCGPWRAPRMENHRKAGVSGIVADT